MSPKAATKSLAPQVEAKLKRHVESEQLATFASMASRQVVDAEFGLLDEVDDFLNARLARIGSFKGESRMETQIKYGEN